MIYGLLQYFRDELDSWSRSIEFHNQELGNLVRQLGVAMEKNADPADNEKETRLMDQLMVQQQQFSHLVSQLAGQRLRLERLLATETMDEGVQAQQTILHSRMHANEKAFLHSRYTCSEFLTSLFEVKVSDQPVQVPLKVVR